MIIPASAFLLCTLLAAALTAVAARLFILSAFQKRLRLKLHRRKPLPDCARLVCRHFNVDNASITSGANPYCDRFSPKKATLFVSDPGANYSIAALAVTLHECGHAVAHSKSRGYRASCVLYPAFKNLLWLCIPLILAALIGKSLLLASMAAALIDLFFLFNLLSMPFEFQANGYAQQAAQQLGLVFSHEQKDFYALLFACAFTGIASTFSVFSQALSSLLRAIAGPKRQTAQGR